MISCICTGILSSKEDQESVQGLSPLITHTKSKLGIVELEDPGRPIVLEDGRRRWPFFADD